MHACVKQFVMLCPWEIGSVGAAERVGQEEVSWVYTPKRWNQHGGIWIWL